MRSRDDLLESTDAVEGTAEGDRYRRLVKRVREGSVDSLAELLERCGPRIARSVRRRLDRRLRSRFDSQDFVQAVWASFFANASAASRFDDEEQLVAYLVGMATNKVVDAGRAANSLKRSLARQQAFVEEEAPRHEATPSQFAIANECWQALVCNLSERERAMLDLRLAGHTFAEIADRVGGNERTVRRLIERLERRTTR